MRFPRARRVIKISRIFPPRASRMRRRRRAGEQDAAAGSCLYPASRYGRRGKERRGSSLKRGSRGKEGGHVFLLARFKQPGSFSSAENAAFKSRSASFPRRKNGSWFFPLSLSFSLRLSTKQEKERGEGADKRVLRMRVKEGGKKPEGGDRRASLLSSFPSPSVGRRCRYLFAD